MQQPVAVPTADPSNLPPPYEEVPPLEQSVPSPAVVHTSTITSSLAVALHRDPGLRPIACRFGGHCSVMFTGAESVATIRQHLQTAHGVEVHPEASSQPVGCPWIAEDGDGCPDTIRTSGMAKHLRDVHISKLVR
ncbi:hypothetical protein FOMPIDRAFT_1051473 [Fomitopsis schrenkii]|uniref:Uncharacterized protein n=1 Tax=Fomitopsis schrenkii TaxID=2126942 RepID=S8E0X4_FOMSC|nr:hypothetical protein FOMPIDRAFT_1051473 [Fomitopsis schrenkii]